VASDASRDQIAKGIKIGAGTVSAIIKECNQFQDPHSVVIH